VTKVKDKQTEHHRISYHSPVLRPTWHETSHFRAVLNSQSLGV